MTDRQHLVEMKKLYKQRCAELAILDKYNKQEVEDLRNEVLVLAENIRNLHNKCQLQVNTKFPLHPINPEI